jgi:DNA-binding MarR family transcriptional regulator
MPSTTDHEDGVAASPHHAQPPTDPELAALAEFRAALRKFMYFSELAADEVGLTVQRFQAILAIRAHRLAQGVDISVGELSDQLLIKDHSAAELVSRLAESRLIRKVSDTKDKRKTLITLTPEGEQRLMQLAAIHLRQLKEHQAAWSHLMQALGHMG